MSNPSRHDWRKGKGQGGGRGPGGGSGPSGDGDAGDGKADNGGGGGKRPAGARPDAASAGRGVGASWRQRRVKASGPSPFRRSLRLGGIGILLLTLIAVFVIWAFRTVTKLPLIAVVVTQYAQPIPPNSLGHEDLVRLSNTNRDNLLVIESAEGDVPASRFWKVLDERLSYPGGGPTKNAIVIYLSAHGVLDDQGRACLLFSDANPLDQSNWVPLEEVLRKISDNGATKKLLLLDYGRIDSNWQIGQLHNGFAAKIAEAYERSGAKNVWIIGSCQEGQVSWPAPEFGCSAFMHFVSEGLRGRASRRESQVSMAELFEYVARNLQQWSNLRRAAPQIPKMVPEASGKSEPDIQLVFSARDAKTPMQLSNVGVELRDRMNGKLERIRPLWSELSRVTTEHRLVHFDPIGLADANNRLLRLEELAFAGSAYDGEFEEAYKRVSNYVARPDFSDVSKVVATSLPLESMLRRPQNGADRAAWLEGWKSDDANPGLKPKKDKPPLPKIMYDSAADVGWQWISTHASPTRNRIRDVLTWIDGAEGSGGASARVEWNELHFLRMLDRYLDRSATDTNVEANLVPAVKAALAVRSSSEAAAVRLDERTQYWTWRTLDQADDARRVAEDLIFVGDPSLVRRAVAQLQEVQNESAPNGFPAATQLDKTVRNAMDLRDQTWHELGYLAEWSIRRGKWFPDERDVLSQRVSNAIRACHELGNQVDDQIVRGDFNPANGLTKVVEETESRLAALRKGYFDNVEYQKSDAGEDSERLRDIWSVLRTPFPQTSDRQALLERYVRLLFADYQFNDQGEHRPVPPSTELEWLKQLPQHPALELLDRTYLKDLGIDRKPVESGQGRNEDPIKWMAKQGGEVRANLATVLNMSNKLESITNDRLGESAEQPPLVRSGLSQADRLTRASASLLGRVWTDSEADPAHRLAKVDFHFYSLWQCKRMLEDCWGAAPGQSESYFGRIADQLLTAAKGFCDKPKAFRYGADDLRLLLDARKAAVKRFVLEPSSVQTVDEQVPKQTISVSWAKGLPAGVAASFIHTGSDSTACLAVIDEQNETVRRRAVDLRKGENLSLAHTLTNPDSVNAAGAPDFAATLLFRGHVVSKPFEYRRAKRPIVAGISPVIPPDARVTVYGDSKRRGFIMFIFDCSYSTREQGRMENARDTLKGILRSLRDSGGYNVGLRAFAHRARWVKDGEGKFVPQMGPLAMGREIDPDKDVELLSPIVPLNTRQLDELNEQLDKLRPFGVTPLYHSIEQSIREDQFASASPEEPKRIIVITDGINETNLPSSSQSRVLDARRDTPRNSNVQIDIVLIDRNIVVKNPDNRKRVEELESLSKQTGGTYYPADNPDELKRALIRALKVADYSVTKGGDPPSETRIELGKTMAVSPLTGERSKYVAEIHGLRSNPKVEFELEGGEWLRLEYSSSRGQLGFVRYLENDLALDYAAEDVLRDPRNVVDKSTTEEYEVIGLLPRKSGRDVRFFVSIQNRDLSKFTPRPRQVWAEIQPVDATGEPIESPRHFYDPIFVMNRPVPVFEFSATEWPEQATQAVIRFWCKMRPSELNIVTQHKISSANSTFTVPELSDVKFQVRTESVGANRDKMLVIVTEEHPPGNDPNNLYRSRMTIVPTPDQIRHKYYVGADRVRHEFEYGKALSTSPTLHVTPRDAVRKDAIHVPTLKVKVRE